MILLTAWYNQVRSLLQVLGDADGVGKGEMASQHVETHILARFTRILDPKIDGEASRDVRALLNGLERTEHYIRLTRNIPSRHSKTITFITRRPEDEVTRKTHRYSINVETQSVQNEALQLQR